MTVFSDAEFVKLRRSESDAPRSGGFPLGVEETENPKGRAARKAIGERMALLMERYGLSGAQMREAAGLKTDSSITQWRKGDTVIAWDNAVKLCQRFDITMDWIYRGATGSLPPPVYERLYGPRDPSAQNTKPKKRPPLSAAE